MSITATIITLNEEDNIEACIESARQVCSEIVVVDSISHDHTQTLARQSGAIVIEQEYLGDGPQKALGAYHASNDWVLSLDADERLETDAVDAIKALDLKKTNKMYAFKRRNFVGDKWIKAAGFYPDYVTRLYNKKVASYQPKKAHAAITGADAIKLSAHLTHYTYKDYSHWLSRINQLSSRDAWAKHQNGQTSTLSGAIARAGFAFFKKLFIKRGILQGSDGWMIAIGSAIHVYMKYAKLAELHEKAK